MIEWNIMSFVWGVIFQWGSTLKVSIELTSTSRHCCDMTERLLKWCKTQIKQTNSSLPCFSYNFNQSVYYLLMCLQYCWMSVKQCRPRSDTTFCGIWSGSTLFAQACLSHYLGCYDISILATEIQNIQIADGDVCRGLPIPIFMIFPRLFTCPTLTTNNFKVGMYGTISMYSWCFMAQTSLEPWKFILDMGSLSHWGLIIVSSQEPNWDHLEMSFPSSKNNSLECTHYLNQAIQMITHNIHFYDKIKFP